MRAVGDHWRGWGSGGGGAEAVQKSIGSLACANTYLLVRMRAKNVCAFLRAARDSLLFSGIALASESHLRVATTSTREHDDERRSRWPAAAAAAPTTTITSPTETNVQDEQQAAAAVEVAARTHFSEQTILRVRRRTFPANKF